MESESPKKGFSRIAIRGAGWNYSSFFSGKLISFLTTVILARLLTKDDFGLVAYALTFIAFLEVMRDFVVGMSLIYHEESDKVSNTSFWLTLGIGLILFTITFASAPLIGAYFNDLRVIPIVRVLGLTFPLGALGATHSYVLQKKLAFGLKFIPDISQTIAKGFVSIAIASLGFGPWSLVWGQIGGIVIWVIVMWIINPWRPAIEFDGLTARSLLSYGSKLIGVDVMSIFSSNLDYLFIGRFLGSEILGIYTLAFRLPELLIGGFARIIGNITFPIFMRMKTTPGSLLRGFYTTTQYVSLISMPLGIGLALLARPFTLVVFTAKWIELVPIMQALSIYSLLNSLVFNAGTIFKAEGHPEIITWLELAHVIMLFPAFWWAVISFRSIVAVGWLHALVAFVLDLITIAIAVRLIGVTWLEMFKSIRPSLIASFPMILVVLFVSRMTESSAPIVELILAILTGFVTYVVTLWIFQRDLVLDVFQRVWKAKAI
jgi:O-antigen/teichoic acid export membrane protein